MSGAERFSFSDGGTALADPPRERRRAQRRVRAAGPPGGRPPDEPGDGGRGGGGDGAEGGRGPDPAGTASLGLTLGMISIAALFAIFVAAYVYVRRHSTAWPPAGQGAVPPGLWLSSALLAGCSSALVLAHRGARSLRRTRYRRALSAAFVLGASFLTAQAWVWNGLVRAGRLPEENAYLAIFYALTGLHALHVAGGLVSLGLVLAQALRGGTPPLESIRLCGRYWHFMGIVWALVFLALYWPKEAS